MTGLNFKNILLTHNVLTSQSSSGVYIVVTMVVIGLGERNGLTIGPRWYAMTNGGRINATITTKEQKRYRQKQHKCKKECEKEKIQKQNIKRQIIQKRKMEMKK